MKPFILDVYCKAGGAGVGYARAGFGVVGVDKEPQPNYPFEFIQADALDVLADREFIRNFQAAHTSPPCQAHTAAWKIQKNEHPDLIAPTRELLERSGLPYVIENVVGAPLLDPVELCGCMFPALNVYRPRLFETGGGLALPRPGHRPHVQRQTKMGRKPVPGERMHVVGNFSGVAEARRAMDIDWMTRDELAEAIPPAYTEFIGHTLRAHLTMVEVAA